MENDKEKFKKAFIDRLINFSISIIKYCDKLNIKSIKDQLIRSATSVGANVVEAKSSSSKKDYIKFFDIALKSSNETEYWLLICRQLSSDSIVEYLLKENDEIARIIATSLLTLKGRR